MTDKLPDEVVPAHLRRRIRQSHQDIRKARESLWNTLEDVKDWIDASLTPLVRYARQQAFGRLNDYQEEKPDGPR